MTRNRVSRPHRDWRIYRAFCRNILVIALSAVSVLLIACFLSDIALFLKGEEVGTNSWASTDEYTLLGIGF
jgi:hypothetical protein